METQKDINARMRTVLVDWLIEVHRKFKLSQAAYFLGINMVDRYLAKVQVKRTHLQLLGRYICYICMLEFTTFLIVRRSFWTKPNPEREIAIGRQFFDLQTDFGEYVVTFTCFLSPMITRLRSLFIYYTFNSNF